MWRTWAKGALVLAAGVVPFGAAAVLAQGCGSTTVESDAGADGETDAGPDADAAPPEPVVTVLTPDAPPLPGQTECKVTITTGLPITGQTHVAVCSEVAYATNPPSSGNHWGVWASYTTYEAPVPREMYVHNLEHGAVVLLHDCEGECPEVLAAFADARAEVTGDPKCLTIPDGPKERVLVTPDPELDVPVAAAAWGATYRATCVDPASLKDFVKKVYGKGPEAVCGELSGVIPVCADGGVVDGGAGGGGAGMGGAGGSGGAGGG